MARGQTIAWRSGAGLCDSAPRKRAHVCGKLTAAATCDGVRTDPMAVAEAHLPPFAGHLQTFGRTAMNIIIWLVVGGVIGWLASMLMKTDGQQGIFLNVIVGI